MSLLPAAGFLLSASATAQEDVLELEDVSLSADFRPDSLHDSNAAVSVVDEFAIEERGALHLESILNVAPNLNFAGGTSRARFVQIRGIGERSQFR
ncbi:MAG TPA: TonB-dependent receptor, partial [Gammaproteobacteria bacterium]|nr:TonB-dependent receptor [Gammaproteobacteria bacterium]